jgi:hypothetical protein
VYFSLKMLTDFANSTQLQGMLRMPEFWKLDAKLDARGEFEITRVTTLKDSALCRDPDAINELCQAVFVMFDPIVVAQARSFNEWNTVSALRLSFDEFLMRDLDPPLPRSIRNTVEAFCANDSCDKLLEIKAGLSQEAQRTIDEVVRRLKAAATTRFQQVFDSSDSLTGFGLSSNVKVSVFSNLSAVTLRIHPAEMSTGCCSNPQRYNVVVPQSCNSSARAILRQMQRQAGDIDLAEGWLGSSF